MADLATLSIKIDAREAQTAINNLTTAFSQMAAASQRANVGLQQRSQAISKMVDTTRPAAKATENLAAAHQKSAIAVRDSQAQSRLLRRDLSNVGKASDQTTKSLIAQGNAIRNTALQYTLLAAAIGSTAAAFDRLIKRGGEMVTLTTAYNNATGSAASATRRLRQASRGLISDYDLMVKFNRALTLGASDNVEQFAALTEVSLALGRAMGVDATFALESLSLGIGRQSRLFLDNLGLIVRVDDAYNRYAKTIGKSVKDFTEEDRRLAFRILAFERAREKLEELGGIQLNSADAWKQLMIAIRNATDEVSQKLAKWEALGVALKAMADAVNTLAGNTGQVRDFADALNLSLLGAEPEDALNTLNAQLTAFGQQMAALSQTAPTFGERIAATLKMLPLGIGALEFLPFQPPAGMARAATALSPKEVFDQAKAIKDLQRQIDEVREAIKRWSEALADKRKEEDPDLDYEMTQRIKELNQQLKLNTAEMEFQEEEVAKLVEQKQVFIGLTQVEAAAIEKLIELHQESREKVTAVKDAWREYLDEVESGAFVSERTSKALEGVLTDLNNINRGMATYAGEDDPAARANRAAQALNKFREIARQAGVDLTKLSDGPIKTTYEEIQRMAELPVEQKMFDWAEAVQILGDAFAGMGSDIARAVLRIVRDIKQLNDAIQKYTEQMKEATDPEVIAALQKQQKTLGYIQSAAIGFGAGQTTGSPLAGAFAGATAGAATGNAYAAVAGGVAGLVSGLWESSKRAAEARKEMERAIKGFMDSLDDFINSLKPDTAFKRYMEEFTDIISGFFQAFYNIDITEIDKFQDYVSRLPERIQKVIPDILKTLDASALDATSFEQTVVALNALIQDALRRGAQAEADALFQMVEGLAEFWEQLKEEAARRRQDFIDDIRAREAAALGDDQTAARIRAEAAYRQELRAAQDLAEQGVLTAQDLEYVSRVLELEFQKTLEDIAEAAREAAMAMADFIDSLEVRAFTAAGRTVEGQRRAMAFQQSRELRDFDRDYGSIAGSQQVKAALMQVHLLERLAFEADAVVQEAQAQLQVAEENLRIAEDQLGALQDQINAQQETVDELRRVQDALEEFSKSLLIGPQSPLAPFQQLQEAQRQFDALAALARGGDLTAAESLPDAARTLLDALRAYFGSSIGYVEGFNDVRAVLAEVQAEIGSQLTVEERTLAELEAQAAVLREQVRVAEQAVEVAKANLATAERQRDAILAKLEVEFQKFLEQLDLLRQIRDAIRNQTDAIRDTAITEPKQPDVQVKPLPPPPPPPPPPPSNGGRPDSDAVDREEEATREQTDVLTKSLAVVANEVRDLRAAVNRQTVVQRDNAEAVRAAQ